MSVTVLPLEPNMQGENTLVTSPSTGGEYRFTNPWFEQQKLQQPNKKVSEVFSPEVQQLLTEKSKGDVLGQFTLIVSGLILTLDLFDPGKAINLNIPPMKDKLSERGERLHITSQVDRADTLKQHVGKVREAILKVYNGSSHQVTKVGNCAVSDEHIHNNALDAELSLFIKSGEKGELILTFLNGGSKGFASLFNGFLQEILLQLSTADRTLEDIFLYISKEVFPAAWDGTKTVIEGNVIETFKQWVCSDPEATAVVSGNTRLTFAELEEKSDSLAVTLKNEYQVQSGDRVLVISPNTHHVVISMIALMKLGAVYVPVDVESSEDRLANIIEDANPVCLLLNSDAFGKVSQFSTIPMFAIDFQMDTLEHAVLENVAASQDSVAYMIYTSGTTGKPKGICVRHDAYLNMLLSVNSGMQVPNKTNIQQAASIGFDVSVMEMGMALVSGSAIYMMPRAVSRDLEKYVDFIQSNEIKVVGIPPAVMNLLPLEQLNEMIIYTGGEAPSVDVVRVLIENGNQLFNQYGLTETACVSLLHTFNQPSRDSDIYIGKPIANTQVVLLNDEGEPIPRGTVGHIWIGGVGINPANEAISATGAYLSLNVEVGSGMYYKTGDLGLMMPDGKLIFLGRTDNQVKIRGNRVELSAVETTVQQLNSVIQTRVLYNDQPDPHLVAFCKVIEGIHARELKAALSAKYPDYWVPAYWVLLEEFPVTINGKVDDRVLRTMEYRSTQEISKEDLSETEMMIMQIWRKVLNHDQMGLEDNFFEVGGHSLKATQIVSEINESLETDMELHDFFANPTIKGLAAIIETSDKIKQQKWETLPLQEKYEASHAQKRLWLLNQIVEDETAYNIYSANKVKGELAIEAFGQAVDALIQRHEILRTNFVYDDEKLWQRVLPKEEVKNRLIYQDLRKMLDVDGVVAKEIKRLGKLNFRMDDGHLFVCKLLQTGPDEYFFLFCMHHIISDGWSIQILIRDLMHLYAQFSDDSVPVLTPLNIQYKEYANWQNEQLSKGNFDHEKAYWHKQLSGTLPVLELPVYKSRPAKLTANGAVHSVKLPEVFTDRFQQFRQDRAVSLFVITTAIVKVLFYHLTHQKDILLGTIISGRDNRNVQDQIGYYLNTVVLRSLMDPTDTFKEVLVKIKGMVYEAFEHAHYPFDLLVDELAPENDLSRSPFFDVLVEAHNFEGLMEEEQAQQTVKDALQLSHVGSDNQTAIYDLNIVIREEEDGTFFDIKYNTDVFEGTQIQSMSDQFCLLADRLMTSPDTPVGKLSIISKEESQFMKVMEGHTIDLSLDQTILDAFDKMVRQYPNKVAIQYKGQQLSYQQLDEESDRIAGFLISREVATEEVVAVVMYRNHTYIAALLGIWKAGACYLPITPDMPPDRMSYMLEQAHTRVIVTDPDCWETSESSVLPIDGPYEILCTGDTQYSGKYPQCYDLSTFEPTEAVSRIALKGDQLAYILYTSGSTGKPKAAMIEHQGMLNHLLAKLEDLNITHESVIAQNASQSFDISIWQMFTALLAGGTTLVIPNDTILDEPAMVSLLSEAEVTVLEVVPSYLSILSAYLSDAPKAYLQSLQSLLVTGEVVRPHQVNTWLTLFPEVPVLNAYGPTEASDDITHHWITDKISDDRTVPIGKPIRNTRLKILSPEGEPCAVGVKGELQVTGIGVGRGYYGDDEKTKKTFSYKERREDASYLTGDIARLLPSGDIEFLGRADAQVKVRGYRIELGEIENHLSQLPGIDHAVVFLDTLKNLLAFVYSEKGTTDEAQCKLALKEKLPAYMIPSFIGGLPELPLTANGKVDRKAIEKLMCEELSTNEETNYPEGELAEVWGEVLGRADISASDHFFELGGHSISATRLSTQIQKRMGVHLSLKEIFQYPVLNEQQELLARKQENQVKAIEEAPELDLYPVSNAQKRLWLQDQLVRNQVTYNMPAAYVLKGYLQREWLESAFMALINRHESIRTLFVQDGDEVFQKILPARDFDFGLNTINLEGLTEPHHEVKRLIDQELQTPFDLREGPLFRASLVRISEEEHILLFSTHHIVSDGWSMGILIRDFIQSYNGLSAGLGATLDPLPIQYKDYAWWQQQNLDGEEFNRAESYWKSRMEGEIPVLELPLDLPRGDHQSFRGAVFSFELTSDCYHKVKAMEANYQVTLFSVLTSCIYILLYRLTGQTDMILGFPAAGRNHHLLEDQIGFYINTLVLRIQEGDQIAFEELIKHTQKQVLEAYEHEAYPFDMLVSSLRLEETERNSLFDVMVQIQNASQEERLNESLAALEVSSYPYELHGGVSKFDLTFNLTEKQDTVRVDIEYNTDLFFESSISTMGRELLNILDCCINQPDLPIHAVKMQLMEQSDPDRLKYYQAFNEEEIIADF